jgi:hypothetical protein
MLVHPKPAQDTPLTNDTQRPPPVDNFIQNMPTLPYLLPKIIIDDDILEANMFYFGAFADKVTGITYITTTLENFSL